MPRLSRLPLLLAVPVLALAACSSGTPDSAPSGARLDPFALRLGNAALVGDLPPGWKAVEAPRTDGFGMLLGGAYSGSLLRTEVLDAGMPAASMVIDGYPHAVPGRGGAYAPSLTLMTYPETFSADDPEGYQAMTAAQKAEEVEPLQRIYAQRGLGSLELGQADVRAEPAYRGGWWGNAGYRSDRLAVRYVESADGALRGVAFFANEGQDYGFHPAYKAVLIQPSKRIIATLYLPMEGFNELAPFASASQDTDAIIAAQEQGYAYLDTPSRYAATPLGAFVRGVDAVVHGLSVEEGGGASADISAD